LNIAPWKSWLPLIVLVWVVRRWLQIVAAQSGANGGFFNGLLMKQTRNSKEDMGRKHGCFRYETTIVASGRAVSGFVCVASNKTLLYLTLDQR
ncbi:MAG: hypothetical protein ACK4K3_11215, partial [Aquabacterium sp.]